MWIQPCQEPECVESVCRHAGLPQLHAKVTSVAAQGAILIHPLVFSFAVITFRDFEADIYQQQASELGVNRFQNKDDYWQDGTSAIWLSYLPYFSNCEGFGHTIPLWALAEQSRECQLVPLGTTKPIKRLAYLSTAVADQCRNVRLRCLYDEVFNDKQVLPRWFEVNEGAELFYITRYPMKRKDLDSGKTRTVPLVPVSPSTDLPRTAVDCRLLFWWVQVKLVEPASEDSLPGRVVLDVYYWQENDRNKEIIRAEVKYQKLQTLDKAQQRGQVGFR